MTEHHGRCSCGDIAFSIAGDIPDARVCHCSKCRRAFGGPGSFLAWIAPETFSWTKGGDLLTRYPAESVFSMGFCPRCGSKLCGVFKEQIVCVSLGSLDDTADVRIDEHIFVGSKARWDIIGGDAPQFEERNPAAKPKLA